MEWLAERAFSFEYRPEEIILEMGTPSDGLYIIASGQVRFTSEDRGVSQLEAGNYFGELSLLGKKERTAVIEAITHAQIYHLSKRHLNGFAQEFPDPYSIIVTNLARELARRIRQLNASTSDQGGLNP
jgi:CRP-like cAMP-binding protein